MRFLLLPVCAAALLAQSGRPTVSLENALAQITFDLAGGSLVDFHLKGAALNPFAWEERGGPQAPRPRGHFLCLDRWGAPSSAERDNGMPFHGEASRVLWKVTAQTAEELTMEARLPLAGIEVRRIVRLAAAGAMATVTEVATNTNPLGRIYNMVQHPTIGPPFLDESTLVDSNARKGFMQSSPLPNPEEPPVWWPFALKDAQQVDMRRLHGDPNPNVVSYTIDEDRGWVTAANPGRRLLVGYVWATSDYPWFNAWRHSENGKPVARGLEFGTTGLHQPFPVLVRKGRIFGRSLFEHLDAGQSATRSYTVFLIEVPAEYAGAARVVASSDRVTVHGRIGGPLSTRQ
jgi:hypothetical protein